MVAMVAGIEDDKVLLDGNHPLAGLTLTFDVKVIDVREATEEELAGARQEACGCGASQQESCGCSGSCGEGCEH